MRGLIYVAAVAASVVASSPPSSQGENAIGINNFTFSPAEVTVVKGASVTWTNKDDIPHSIVLDSIGVRSKAMDTDALFTYRFDKAGRFGYICGLHPQMHGQVVVR